MTSQTWSDADRPFVIMNDAENFERRDTDNIRRWRWWFNLTPSSRVGKDDLLRLITVQRKIVCPCPRLNVVYLGRPLIAKLQLLIMLTSRRQVNLACSGVTDDSVVLQLCKKNLLQIYVIISVPNI